MSEIENSSLRASQGVHLKSALLTHIRQELRTPINAIIGYSEMLLEDAASLKRDDFIPDLQKIHVSGKNLLGLVNEILDPEKLKADVRIANLQTFGASVRHDLRTPINAIVGYSEMLLEDADGFNERFIADLHKVHKSGNRLLVLIDDIVDFSQKDLTGGDATKAFDTEAETTHVPDLIRDVVMTLHPIAETNVCTALQGSLLVVDDNEVNRDILSRRLAREGHTMSVACDGVEALRMMREGKFDLVLLDIIMPGMNGYQVLQHIKSDLALRDVPVIMISALNDIESVVHCIEMGAEDYLPKPFNPVLLKARIDASLEKKRLRDAEKIYLEQLRVEREKSERLLLNVLPKSIADQLRENQTVIAEKFDDATVLFADLVNFTEWSAGITPVELVYTLNEVFSRFDELTARYGLEKIKTIGDGYMVAGGIPQRRDDHAEAIAEMALDMQDALADFNREHSSAISIRTGINVGPVVAGIIGTKKFIYDLWGNTVNTASRMESHSLAGCIQVTGETHKRLEHKYRFDKRGLIQVKGIGETTTYFLVGRK